ncbi:transcription initiation factor IIA, gamma subunit [Artemisia annua]|uniref:Transcription initiation factor IIA, gamma subunit n=1 Tax=Artemisia annua TaxID=35608 RepID=A0A2U1P4K0_ARTAN|nr:transcription initiation factor IIA, gamma subunit [Artemisia annua]
MDRSGMQKEKRPTVDEEQVTGKKKAVAKLYHKLSLDINRYYKWLDLSCTKGQQLEHPNVFEPQSTGVLEPDLAMQVLVQFEKGHLRMCRFCDNVWMFILQDALVKYDES